MGETKRFCSNHGQVRDARHGYLTRCAVVSCEEAVALLVREQESKGKPSDAVLKEEGVVSPTHASGYDLQAGARGRHQGGDALSRSEKERKINTL